MKFTIQYLRNFVTYRESCKFQVLFATAKQMQNKNLKIFNTDWESHGCKKPMEIYEYEKVVSFKEHCKFQFRLEI
jgi:hypothetical protein